MNWMKLEEGEHNRFKVVSDIGTDNSVSGSVLFEYSYDTGILGVGTIFWKLYHRPGLVELVL